MRSRSDKRSWFVIGSLLVHLSIFYALQAAALRPEKQKAKRVELTLYKPPEPPPPEPEKPKPVIDLTKKVEIVKKQDATPPPEAPPADEPPPPPVFGLSLASTTDQPSGFQVRVGNTTMTEPGARVDPKDVKPLTGNGTGRAPVSMAQVSKQPEVVGECPPFDASRLYTKAALDAEIEGKVILDVTLGEDGLIRGVNVAKGLGHGLDEAASAMIRDHCRFKPAELGSEKVATKFRYTVIFVMPE